MDFDLLNGYTQFLKQYIIVKRRYGRIISYREAFQDALPHWLLLSEKEQEEYKRDARRQKEIESVPSDAYNEDGIEQEFKVHELSVATAVFMMDIINARLTDDLLDYEFFVAHCNYFCKEDNGKYFIAEFALSRFNISDGIGQTLHKLFDPKILPPESVVTAEAIGRLTHRIKLPPYILGNDGFSNIFEKITTALEDRKENTLRPIFVDRENIKVVQSFLKQAYDMRDNDSEYLDSDVNIYPVDLLLLYLNSHFLKVSEKKFSTEEWCHNNFDGASEAYNELLNLKNFNPEPTCFYHFGLIGHEQFCSFNIAARRIFTILKLIRKILGLSIIPGKHSAIVQSPDDQQFCSVGI